MHDVYCTLILIKKYTPQKKLGNFLKEKLKLPLPTLLTCIIVVIFGRRAATENSRSQDSQNKCNLRKTSFSVPKSPENYHWIVKSRIH
jgi:hypothetical protein